MPQPVHILGAARTDFRRNLSKEGKTLGDILREAAIEALRDADVEAQAVQSAVVGNFAAGMFTHQLHLGALLTEVPGLRGVPSLHVEAACASGAMAVLTGAQQIMAGIYDVVLVAGVEQQKTMSPAAVSDVLGAAGDYGNEKARFGDFMFPKLFGRIAELYAGRYALSERQLATVVAKNYAHAQLNPDAQMRGKPMTIAAACTESEANLRIAPPLKTADCSQISDGAAAVVLCSEAFARRRLSRRRRVRLLGFGNTTDKLAVDAKDIPEFPFARMAAARAYEMAGVGPRDIDCAEVHDCFSISEIVAYELLGFAEPGEGGPLVESGATTLPQIRPELFGGVRPRVAIPVNPGGGLIGDGHPVGATGVRQVVEAYRHLTESAGARQVEGARRCLTFNMGGTMTTSVAMIWGE